MTIFRKPDNQWFRTGSLAAGLIEMYEYLQPAGQHWVEIGSARGESAEIASQFVAQLDCVEPFRPGYESNEPFFHARVGDLPNVRHIKLNSHVACEQYEDSSLDGVYIDGDHDYENVVRDVLCWFPKVKVGGWIACHDYDGQPEHADVVRAVDEIFGNPAADRVFQDTSCLFQKTAELKETVNQRYPAGGAT